MVSLPRHPWLPRSSHLLERTRRAFNHCQLRLSVRLPRTMDRRPSHSLRPSEGAPRIPTRRARPPLLGTADCLLTAHRADPQPSIDTFRCREELVPLLSNVLYLLHPLRPLPSATAPPTNTKPLPACCQPRCLLSSHQPCPPSRPPQPPFARKHHPEHLRPHLRQTPP